MITRAVKLSLLCATLAACAGPAPIRGSTLVARVQAESIPKTLNRDSAAIPAGRVLDQCPRCSRQWFITNDGQENAAAIGGNVYITSGLLGYLKTPDEFAFVFAHELAHIILKHGDVQSPYHAWGSVLGAVIIGDPNFGATVARSIHGPGLETAADKMAVDLMMSAGYNPGHAIMFMKRWAPEGGMTHPDYDSRIKSLEAAVSSARTRATVPPPPQQPAAPVKLMKGSDKIVDNWP